ncbi:MAG: energy-coupling factor transporter transmembrane component T [Anaerolineae bacterium]
MHPVAWFVWLALAALSALLTRNPLYLIILFGIAQLVAEAIPDARTHTLPVAPVRFALFSVLVGALFNGLTTHVGTTILFTLPEALPLLGGPVTAEALAFGAINGLALATLFAIFAVLNAAVPVRELVTYLPRAFYPIAVVSAIAVTFVPSTLRQFEQVREAQAIRGHRMRGLRDWLPLFMPVLTGGLERALQLAEAMTARGFATGAANGGPRVAAASRFASLGGLVSVLIGGVLRLVPRWASWSVLFLSAGILLVGLAVWRAGRDVKHTRYRHLVWSWLSTLSVAGAVVAVGLLLVWGASRDYSPYPTIAWSPFDLRVGIGLLGFLIPSISAHISQDLSKESHGDD